MTKKLVLIGGGHAHMETLANLGNITDKGYRVTVIAPSEYHYYSGMGPGMLGGSYTPEEIRFHTRKVVEERGGKFVLDSAVRIDPGERFVRTAADREIPYDVLSCNVGSYIEKPEMVDDPGNIFSVKPIEKLYQAHKKILALIIEKQITIAIIGGGPSAAEIAGNVDQLAENSGGYKPKIIILAGNVFMKRFPEKTRKMVHRILTGRNIEIIEKGRAKLKSYNTIELGDGEKFSGDLIFLATGVHPARIFAKSGLPVGPDGGLLVNRFLQSEKHPEIFGGGDCIDFEEQPLDKVGVHAVRQNPILYRNLLSALQGSPLKKYTPNNSYLLIFNLGKGEGVLHKGRLTFKGKSAFIIKDYIDRKFMRRFQVLEKKGNS